MMIGRMLAMASLATALAAAAANAELQTFGRDELTIESGGEAHRFTVELAVTPEQRGQGLMYRERLPAEAGMLFLYPTEQMISMWMKNTLIPLDMLFIAEDGRIIHIAERAIPGSLATISSGQPARAVLELNGGTAARLDIAPGDRVLYETFGTAE
jgi:uncharacterized membrane protein (UPF0127 family)